MLRRTSITLVLTVVVAIVALFAATEVMAFSNEPCYGLNYDCETCDCNPPGVGDVTEIGNYTVTLKAVTPIAGDLFDWWFEIKHTTKGTASGLNFAALCIPDCCALPKIQVWTTVDNFHPAARGFMEINDVGKGETVLNYGRFDQHCFVVKGTPDASTDWHLIVNTNHMTRGEFVVMWRGGYDSNVMTIPGCTPAAPPPDAPVGPATHTECINFGLDTPDFTPDDISFNITRMGDAKGCIQSIVKCTGLCGDQLNCETVPPEDLPTDYLHRGALRPGVCPNESVSVSKTNTPFYLYDITSGGCRYVLCLDLDYPITGDPWAELRCCGVPIGPDCHE